MSANNISLKTSVKLVWLKRGVALSVLLGFAWLVVSAFTTDVNDEELSPMVVKAPELVKQRPETPGGMKIDHQDKQLFDLLESETSDDEVNKAVVENAKKIEEQNNALVAQALEKKQLAEKLAQEKAKQEAAAKEVAVKAVKVQAVKPVVVKTEVKKEPVAKAVKPVVATKPAAEVKTAAEVSGWAVQLGSFRQDADADRAVGVYTKKVGNILAGLKPYVKKVNLGAKGTVYRVYFTGLKDAEHAKQICSQLKVQKQACLRSKL